MSHFSLKENKMKNKTTHFLIAVCALSVLSACGKKEDSTSQTTPVSATAAAEENTPHFKQTEKFGTVSNIVLTPLFQAPAKYSSYVRQEVSEVTKDEYKKLPDSAFEGYVNTWLKQAASVEKPDWQMIAGITHPEITAEANEFKKQEAGDKVKTDIPADKNQLNVAYGWQGQMLFIAGPDVNTGEYYLLIRPDNRYDIVSYQNQKNYRYSLYYRPAFNVIGMKGDNRGDMQLTVKVPIEKAKEIESLREGTSTMIRVYGHVVGVSTNQVPIVRKDGSQAGLSVEVEALEFGVRKNGEFKTFFFLDSDQLKRSKS